MHILYVCVAYIILNYNFSESTLLLRAWHTISNVCLSPCIPRKLQRLLLLTRLKKTSRAAGEAIHPRDRFGSIRVSSLVSRGIVLFLDLERTGHDKKRTVDGTRAFKRPCRSCLTNLVIKMNILSAFMTFCEHANFVHPVKTSRVHAWDLHYRRSAPFLTLPGDPPLI